MDNVTYDEMESKTASLAADTLKMPSWLLEMTDNIEKININDTKSLQMETFLIDEQHRFTNKREENDTINEPSISLNDFYTNTNIKNYKLQTPTSKSLPNTPKSEQVKRKRTRVCSAVVNTKHRTRDDFHGLDAYLERKQMEKRCVYLPSENDNNAKTCDEEHSFEYRILNVPNCADTRLHLLDDTYTPNRSSFITQNEETPKLLSGQYQETLLDLSY